MNRTATSFLPAVILAIATSAGLSAGEIYFVRHAEAPSAPAPRTLSGTGKKQAKRLARLLDRWAPDLDRVYYTDTRRSRETAEPTMQKSSATATCYRSGHADSNVTDCAAPIGVDEMLAAVRDCRQGSTLVVGHSNTLGSLIRDLGVRWNPIAPSPFSQYGHVFFVTCGEEGRLGRLRYCQNALNKRKPGRKDQCR